MNEFKISENGGYNIGEYELQVLHNSSHKQQHSHVTGLIAHILPLIFIKIMFDTVCLCVSVCICGCVGQSHLPLL